MKGMSKCRWVFIALLSLMLTAAVQAGNHWYYQADQAGVAMGGYDPVAYFQVNQAVKGKSDWRATHGGLTYHFSSKENLEQFNQAPTKYLPQYGGWCAFACGVDSKKYGFAAVRFPADPTSFLVQDGKLFLFANIPNFDAKKFWENEDAGAMVARADTFWKAREVLGNKIGTLPEGMNPRAPMETAQFAPLTGKWINTVTWMQNLQTKAYGPEIKGSWSIQYGWDGFGIEDHWQQPGVPGSGGPAFRFYDPRTKKWVMTYIPANQPRQNIWLMEGAFQENGELHGSFSGTDQQGRAFIGKVRFFDIQADQFEWEHHRSYDEGKTWIERVAFSTSKRVK